MTVSIRDIERFDLENDPYHHMIKIVCNKWKPVLIRAIDFEEGNYSRFSRFTKQLPITERVLARNLRELERDGILYRTVYPEVPLRVEYRLTETGKSLCPILDAMFKWGREDMIRKNIEINPMGEIKHGYRKIDEY